MTQIRRTTVMWGELGFPQKPGPYEFRDGTVNVRERDIEIWRRHPNAVFIATGVQIVNTGETQYALGTRNTTD